MKGVLTCIELKDCDVTLMYSAQVISKFMTEALIMMDSKADGAGVFGEFGGEGDLKRLCLMQPLEAGYVVGNFILISQHICLDVFSYKQYNTYQVARHAKAVFAAKNMRLRIVDRG